MAKQKMNIGLKLKPTSIRLAFIAFAIFLLFATLAKFNVWDLTGMTSLVLSVFAAVIIFSEVGLAQAFKTKGKSVDMLGAIGLIAGSIIIITVIFELFQNSQVLAILNPIQGLVFAVLVVSFFIEAFR